MTPEFHAWPKTPRWERPVCITEKIDGTNAAVIVCEDGTVHAQSRKRIITPNHDGIQTDNFGFAAWVQENAEQLRELGAGYHFGEWWGKGIQRGYGLDERRFSLFNVDKWGEQRPDCCHVVPVLERCTMSDAGKAVNEWLDILADHGSTAVQHKTPAEGVCVFHSASRQVFKALIENDGMTKTEAAQLAVAA